MDITVSGTGTGEETDGHGDLISHQDLKVPTEPSSADASASPSSSSPPPPHYGKYIGLTTGFFVFIAYLLCARAYRRQGMYELHEST